MNNNLLKIKIKERLNKLDSNDYDNFECWQIAEAFNKAQIEWVRRQLHGNNLFKEADEQSVRRVDDLEILLKEVSLKGATFGTYFESADLPDNYLQFKRVSIKGSTADCPARPFVVYQGEEANLDDLLKDPNKKPSFDWAETFFTFIGNRARIYTNGEFNVINPKLTYYRFPREVQFKDCINLETGDLFEVDQESEFKRDIVELIIDEACSILAGDTESMNQFQRNTQSAERNN